MTIYDTINGDARLCLYPGKEIYTMRLEVLVNPKRSWWQGDCISLDRAGTLRLAERLRLWLKENPE